MRVGDCCPPKTSVYSAAAEGKRNSDGENRDGAGAGRSESEGGPPGEGEAGPPWKGGASRERRGESGRERGETRRGGKVGGQGARLLRTVGRPRGGIGGERRGL